MQQRTRNALVESIAHWQRFADGTAGEYESTGNDYCALCGLFYNNACHGCPVADRTGMKLCGGSPYRDAVRALQDANLDKSSVAFRSAADREVEFLKSLLTEEK